MDFLLIIIILLLPLAADIGIKINYKKYMDEKNDNGLTGQEVARKILDKHGLKDIYVVETSGTLSDHYDPTRKVVRLSHDIFAGESIASIAVAAHECGHAIQDKDNYAPLKLRSLIYPVVNIATSFSYYVILLGFLLQLLNVIYVGIALTASGLIFQIITLPVEFNASNRAKKELDMMGIINKDEQEGVSKMLTSAALTYVAGVLASAAQILRLILSIRRDD